MDPHTSINVNEGNYQPAHSQLRAAAKGDTAGATPPVGTTPVDRFHCPKCEKSFSRIENLTRHQANRKFYSALLPRTLVQPFR